MTFRYNKLLIIISLLLAQFLMVKVASATVGTSCARSGGGITITVNIFYMPGDGWDLAALNNQMIQVYTPELNKVWNQNFHTSDCNLTVKFQFNSKSGSSCSEAPGYHCIKIYHNLATIKVRCSQSIGCMDNICSFNDPTANGWWYYESSFSGTEPNIGTTYCTPKKEYICEEFIAYVAAHEIGHAMGLGDEYSGANDEFLEKNIMGDPIDCNRSSTGDIWKAGPTQNQIDKIVQNFCRGKDAVCTTTEANDVCSDQNKSCLANHKCAYNDPACKNAGAILPPPNLTQQPVAAPSPDITKLVLQVPIFDYSEANGLPEYIFYIFKYAMIVIVPLAIVMIMWGGIQWIGAAGNSQKIAAAKKQISSAFLGLILGLLTYTLLSYIGITQLYMPTIKRVETVQGNALSIGGGGASGGCSIKLPDSGANPTPATP